MILQDLHTHSKFDDGRGSLMAVAKSAEKLGLTSVGFSGHSPLPYENDWSMTEESLRVYIKKGKAVKAKMRGRVDVLLGIEYDIISDIDLKDFDYVIGSVHYMEFDGKMCGFDRDVKAVREYIKNYFDGDGMKFCREYYDLVSQLPDYGEFDIIGHFDLCVKLNQKIHFVDEGSPEYLSYAFDAIDALKGEIPFFEVNTGCISRGYRNVPYPIPRILKEFKRQGFGAMISSDCHDAQYLDCCYNEAKELLSACGFREIYILTKNGFEASKI